MTEAQRRDILRQLDALQFQYARYGNIPCFGVVSGLAYLAWVAVLAGLWGASEQSLFPTDLAERPRLMVEGCLVLALSMISGWAIAVKTVPSTVKKITRLLVRYVPQEPLGHHEILQGVQAGRLSAHQLAAWLREETFLLQGGPVVTPECRDGSIRASSAKEGKTYVPGATRPEMSLKGDK